MKKLMFSMILILALVFGAMTTYADEYPGEFKNVEAIIQREGKVAEDLGPDVMEVDRIWAEPTNTKVQWHANAAMKKGAGIACFLGMVDIEADEPVSGWAVYYVIEKKLSLKLTIEGVEQITTEEADKLVSEWIKAYNDHKPADPVTK